MTTLAFKATYSDWKVIKTRGVVQVVMEVPLSEADAAYQILGGMPDFSQERWFGVAPLKEVMPHPTKRSVQTGHNNAPPQPAEPDRHSAGAKRDWRDLPPSAQASMLCDKVIFQMFLREKYPDDWHESMADPDECVRLICAVSSKAMLNDGPHRVIWHSLQSEYQTWERIGA